MCTYMGLRVSQVQFIRLMGIEKQIRHIQSAGMARSGFIYQDWPVIRTTAEGGDFEIINAHWEYVPGFIRNAEELQDARKMMTWLNAKSENLFVNDRGRPSMYKEGALHGRCLVPMSGFYEWRHLPKIGKKGQPLKATEKVPYWVTLKNLPADEPFFVAGVMRRWTNIDRQQSADTFAIVTTAANDLMEKVHNVKKRMPTILTKELAEEWIRPSIPEQRVLKLARFQYPSAEMEAWTVDKKFIEKEVPDAICDYPEIPAL